VNVATMKMGTSGMGKAAYGKGRLKSAQGKTTKLGRAKTIATPFESRISSKR
jgi:hypothetical protein